MMFNIEHYYKVYKSERLNGKLTLLFISNREEKGYKQERFLKNKDGKELKFYDEKQAIEWLIKNIREELIDTKYLKSSILEDTTYYK